MSDRVTIKSIADALGVSHMTVSRALSDNPNVHPDTRRAVRERAVALGYVKSAAASAMRGDPTRTVGLVLPDLTDGLHAAFTEAVAERCTAAGLDLVLHLTGHDRARTQAALHSLREVQARATVVLSRDGPHDNDAGSARVLHVSRSGGGLRLCDDAAIADAVAHLCAAGHRHIAFVGCDATGSDGGTPQQQAFAVAMAGHGLRVSAALIRLGPAQFVAGRSAALALLDASHPLSAILCADPLLSDGALAACLGRGLSLPSDLAFVGYGEMAAYDWIGGGIAAISLPVAELASQAMAFVLGGTAPDHCAARFIRRGSV